MLIALGCEAPSKPAAPVTVEAGAALPVDHRDAPAVIDAVLAPADPPELEATDASRWSLGPYELFRGPSYMHVRRGDREAELPVPSSAGQVAVSPGLIRFGYMPACEEVVTAFTTDQLEGHLVYAHGLAMERRRQHAAAAADFARVMALDPARDDATTHAAMALARHGKLDDAVAALAGRLRANPAAVLADVLTIPALQPLWSHRGLAGLRPGRPGSATVSASHGLPPAGVAVAVGTGWLAMFESLPSQMACGGDTVLVIRDGTTLATLASLPLMTSDDSELRCGDSDVEPRGNGLTARGRRAVRAREQRANRFLRDLGFSRPARAVRIEVEMDAPASGTVRFDDAGLSVVVGEGQGRLFRDGTPITEHLPVPSHLRWAVHLPEQKRIVLGGFTFGCEWTEIDDLVGLPVP